MQHISIPFNKDSQKLELYVWHVLNEEDKFFRLNYVTDITEKQAQKRLSF